MSQTTLQINEIRHTLRIDAEDNIQVVSIGIQGPPGPGAASYDFTQSSPSTLWTINHNLGYRPQVELRTTGGVIMLAEVTHISVNQVQVSFAVSTAGTARLN